jgi:hypothetical protein
MAVGQRIHPGTRPQMQQRADDRMIEQILPHRQIGQHGNT